MKTTEDYIVEIKELEEQITELEEELKQLKTLERNFEVDESEHEGGYDDMLNECYEEVFNISPSRILSECDPIAYKCGLTDYVDSLELTFESEHEEEYNRIEEIEDEITELEEQITELEEE